MIRLMEETTDRMIFHFDGASVFNYFAADHTDAPHFRGYNWYGGSGVPALLFGHDLWLGGGLL